MRHKHTIQATLAAAAVAALTLAVEAGDAERICIWRQTSAGNCPTGPQFERFEHWSSSSYGTSGLAWRLYNDASGTVVPGLTPCSGGATNAPGYAGTLAAAAAWSSIPNLVDECPPTDSTTGTISDFEFASSPTLCNGGTCTTTVNTSDGLNTVSFFDTGSFSGAGGSAVLALAFVRLKNNTATLFNACNPLTPNQCSPSNQAYGEIAEADVALNVLSTVGSQAAWGWIAWESAATFVTDTNPVNGFVDCQGVLTHELGHCLGLGHSVVDSKTAFGNSGQGTSHSRFPTMFFRAQAKKFKEQVATDPCNPTQTVQVDTQSFGVSARDLTPDDIAAVGRVYPSSGFASDTATITGLVIDGTTDEPLVGVSVVAVAKHCPELSRIGTLTYGSPSVNPPQDVGVYTLAGLPPGTYYVYAETVDTTTYFPGFFDVPEYVAGGGSPGNVPANYCCFCWQPGACQPTIVPFYPEFYNGNDKRVEDPQRATEITVSAGQTVTLDDIVINPSPNGHTRLEVQEVGVGSATTRGVNVDYSASPATQVTFSVSSNSAYSGADVEVVLSYELKNSMPLLDLWLLDSPIETLTGTLDANGDASFTYDIVVRDQYRNVFAQASITLEDGGSSTEVLTNMVNVWVDQ